MAGNVLAKYFTAAVTVLEDQKGGSGAELSKFLQPHFPMWLPPTIQREGDFPSVSIKQAVGLLTCSWAESNTITMFSPLRKEIYKKIPPHPPVIFDVVLGKEPDEELSTYLETFGLSWCQRPERWREPGTIMFSAASPLKNGFLLVSEALAILLGGSPNPGPYGVLVAIHQALWGTLFPSTSSGGPQHYFWCHTQGIVAASGSGKHLILESQERAHQGVKQMHRVLGGNDPIKWPAREPGKMLRWFRAVFLREYMWKLLWVNGADNVNLNLPNSTPTLLPLY